MRGLAVTLGCLLLLGVMFASGCERKKATSVGITHEYIRVLAHPSYEKVEYLDYDGNGIVDVMKYYRGGVVVMSEFDYDQDNQVDEIRHYNSLSGLAAGQPKETAATSTKNPAEIPPVVKAQPTETHAPLGGMGAATETTAKSADPVFYVMDKTYIPSSTTDQANCSVSCEFNREQHFVIQGQADLPDGVKIHLACLKGKKIIFVTAADMKNHSFSKTVDVEQTVLEEGGEILVEAAFNKSELSNYSLCQDSNVPERLRASQTLKLLALNKDEFERYFSAVERKSDGGGHGMKALPDVEDEPRPAAPVVLADGSVNAQQPVVENLELRGSLALHVVGERGFSLQGLCSYPDGTRITVALMFNDNIADQGMVEVKEGRFEWFSAVKDLSLCPYGPYKATMDYLPGMQRGESSKVAAAEPAHSEAEFMHGNERMAAAQAEADLAVIHSQIKSLKDLYSLLQQGAKFHAGQFDAAAWDKTVGHYLSSIAEVQLDTTTLLRDSFAMHYPAPTRELGYIADLCREYGLAVTWELYESNKLEPRDCAFLKGRKSAPKVAADLVKRIEAGFADPLFTGKK